MGHLKEELVVMESKFVSVRSCSVPLQCGCLTLIYYYFICALVSLRSSLQMSSQNDVHLSPSMLHIMPISLSLI
jgi:hypothetical protein